MARPMSSAMLAAIQAPQLNPAIFVEAHFSTGIVYIWSGTGTVSWNSHSWIGVGSLGSVSTIDEGSDVQARGVTLSLSGIDTSLLADAIQGIQIGLPVIVYLGLFTAGSPPSLIADPVSAWAGRMDQPTVDVGGETATISINCESRLLDMNVAIDRRYTHDDAQIDHPGDLGFQFVTSIQEMNVYWGRTPSSSNNL